MNITLSVWPSVAAILYFLGAYLYWVHVQTVFYLNDISEQMDIRKALIGSILWPYNVVDAAVKMLLTKEEYDE